MSYIYVNSVYAGLCVLDFFDIRGINKRVNIPKNYLLISCTGLLRKNPLPILKLVPNGGSGQSRYDFSYVHAKILVLFEDVHVLIIVEHVEDRGQHQVAGKAYTFSSNVMSMSRL